MRLLEREHELGVLAGAVQDAVAGRGSVVLLSGEAGIGTSSLVRALRERAGEDATFLSGACEPLSVLVPLAPLRELVEQAGGGDLIEVGSDDRLVLARRVASVLAARAPVVAIIEDLHWADPLTLDLMRLLVRRAPELAALLVATFRNDEVGANPPLGALLGDLTSAPGVRRIRLRPLSDAAVRELAGSSGLDIAELVRTTGGNPFLVEAIAAGDRLPASIRDAALARVGRLSPAAREVVDAAAVLGQHFDYRLLVAVVPGSASAVEEALARGAVAMAAATTRRSACSRGADGLSGTPARDGPARSGAPIQREALTLLGQSPGRLSPGRPTRRPSAGFSTERTSSHQRTTPSPPPRRRREC